MADTSPDPQPGTDRQRGKARRALLGLAVAAAVAGAAWGGWWWLRGQYLQSTDDAYLQADSLAVAPKIGGYVAQVLVSDNQQVHQGDLLVRLDARKYRAAADETHATIAAREADLARARAELAQQQASIAEASAQAQGRERISPMPRPSSNAMHRWRARAPKPRSAWPSLPTSRPRPAARWPRARQRCARPRHGWPHSRRRCNRLRLNWVWRRPAMPRPRCDYDDADIRAPLDGRVGDRGVRLGQFVQPGTRLLTVVPVQGLYLTANFKETQIGAMRAGQQVSVKVDALPGRELTGWIDSFAPGTGAQFALLPPANATGNFTKIVQRVPVRIRLEVPGDLQGVLLPGLSATVEVDTRGDTRGNTTAGQHHG
ncbi:HlyD family secretion protein [Pseudomonas sp. KNUC1026]|uniref:HlyD family secretion protein n=1 Tax=Pseudomonas sp. KNUC1026 TaxID=2893890 RepID=UPI001F177249|nr:HlyD family secretion protein [Pseudomonas sp. KNUC1026]UFH50885.1 HlyD family secretion protein [Pseudomonas sp. KNUC1026]